MNNLIDKVTQSYVESLSTEIISLCKSNDEMKIKSDDIIKENEILKEENANLRIKNEKLDNNIKQLIGKNNIFADLNYNIKNIFEQIDIEKIIKINIKNNYEMKNIEFDKIILCNFIKYVNDDEILQLIKRTNIKQQIIENIDNKIEEFIYSHYLYDNIFDSENKITLNIENKLLENKNYKYIFENLQKMENISRIIEKLIDINEYTLIKNNLDLIKNEKLKYKYNIKLLENNEILLLNSFEYEEIDINNFIKLIAAEKTKSECSYIKKIVTPYGQNCTYCTCCVLTTSNKNYLTYTTQPRTYIINIFNCNDNLLQKLYNNYKKYDKFFIIAICTYCNNNEICLNYHCFNICHKCIMQKNIGCKELHIKYKNPNYSIRENNGGCSACHPNKSTYDGYGYIYNDFPLLTIIGPYKWCPNYNQQKYIENTYEHIICPCCGIEIKNE
jgi:hypothetical protein